MSTEKPTTTPRSPLNPADGTPILAQGGQRASGIMSEAEAQAEAARRNRLNEQQGGQAEPVRVVRNLMG